MSAITDSILKKLKEEIENEEVACQCDCCFKDITGKEIYDSMAYRVHGRVICHECYENMVEKGREKHDF